MGSEGKKMMYRDQGAPKLSIQCYFESRADFPHQFSVVGYLSLHRVNYTHIPGAGQTTKFLGRRMNTTTLCIYRTLELRVGRGSIPLLVCFLLASN